MITDEVFAALSDGTRRDLLLELGGGPRRAGDLAEPFDISRPAISRHLRVLREAGLISSEQRGREHWYRLEPGALEPASEWMDHAAAIWPDALSALKRYVESSK
ncbi:MAG: metalloregulator ArsR/SmtB family transcription factor [Acidimicrobiia bacterium]|nr:metalloregulator ArsR/SmtB family transcription factor [Acidimicrobiia bacterium]